MFSAFFSLNHFDLQQECHFFGLYCTEKEVPDTPEPTRYPTARDDDYDHVGDHLEKVRINRLEIVFITLEPVLLLYINVVFIDTTSTFSCLLT